MLLDGMIFLFMRVHECCFTLSGIFTICNIHRTVQAFAEYLERMVKRAEAVGDADIILHLDNAAVIEFDNFSACRANQMIMMRTVHCFFILSMPLRKAIP